MFSVNETLSAIANPMTNTRASVPTRDSAPPPQTVAQPSRPHPALPVPHPSATASWQRQATAIAVVLGTVPVLIVGSMVAQVSDDRYRQHVEQQQQTRSAAIASEVRDIVRHRYRELAAIASNPVLTVPEVRDVAPYDALVSYFNGYVERDPTYSILAPVTPEGQYGSLGDPGSRPRQPLRALQSQVDERADDPNYNLFIERPVPSFLDVRTTLEPAVSPLHISSETGRSAVYLAVPAFTHGTRELAYVVYGRTDASELAAQVRSRIWQGSESASTLKFALVDRTAAYFERADEQEREISPERIQREGDTVAIDRRRTLYPRRRDFCERKPDLRI